MDEEGLAHLLTWAQHGVVSRRQLLAFGANDADIARMLRRRELTRVHRGVFVNHTGELDDAQRGWAAVLAHWPAGLARSWAAPGARRSHVVEVAIAHGRTVPVIPGVRTVRIAGFERRVDLSRNPPMDRPADAVLDLMASEPRPDLMFTRLAEAVATREVWPDLLREAVAERNHLRGRTTILSLIADIEVGANSVLERGWLITARTHGLPAGRRQVRAWAGDKVIRRDVLYADQRVVVELDGRAWHDNVRARDRDAGRDLAAVIDGLTPVRLTYGQVFRDGCATAAQVAVLLRRHGWAGQPNRCSKCR